MLGLKSLQHWRGNRLLQLAKGKRNRNCQQKAVSRPPAGDHFNSMQPLENRLLMSADTPLAIQFGSELGDVGQAIAVDDAGNIYATGTFTGTVDFDPDLSAEWLLTSSVEQSNNGPGKGKNNNGDSGFVRDTFLAKYAPSGDLTWAMQLGPDAYIQDVAVHSTGVYVSGLFRGAVPELGLDAIGTLDLFVGNIAASDGSVTWVRHVGGAEGQYSNWFETEVAADASDNLIFGVAIQNDPTIFGSPLTVGGTSDIYVGKLDSSGNLIGSNHFGGSSTDDFAGIDVDSVGNIYVAGDYGTSNFEIDGMLLPPGGLVYAAKFDPSLNLIGYQTIGDADDGVDVAWDVSVSDAGVFILGSSQHARTFGNQSFNFEDVTTWVARLDSDLVVQTGQPISHAPDYDQGWGISAGENVVYAAMTHVLPGEYFGQELVGTVVTQLDLNANLLDAWQFGSSNSAALQPVAVSPNDSLVVTGWFSGEQNLGNLGSFTSAGGGDGFIAVVPVEPGVRVSPASNSGEDGTSATFDVALNTQPTDNVTITFSSNDASEGTVDPATSSLTFTPSDWKVAQTVVVHGVDDAEQDGDVTYSVTGPLTSNDPDYNSLDPAEVTIVNVDDELPAGDASNMYVWDIVLESQTRTKGKNKVFNDLRVSVTVRHDSDADNIAESTDTPVGGANLTIEVRDSSGSLLATLQGQTDIDGETIGTFTSDWIQNVADDTYTAEVTQLSAAGLTWDPNGDLDPVTGNDADTDGDGQPEDSLAIPQAALASAMAAFGTEDDGSDSSGGTTPWLKEQEESVAAGMM